MFSTFVVAMAADAGCVHQAVKAFSRLHAASNLLVAIEALGVGNTFSGIMTLQAIGAFKILMSLDERAWS